MSLYTANLKTKEIGIRKVLGANVSSILISIAKEYFYLILISVIISIPILIWGIKEWLNNFAIKMHISIWLFILPVFIVLIITFISISVHTVKAARRKPVDTLKYE